MCVLCMGMYIQRVHTSGDTYMCIEAWGWSQVSRDGSLFIYCVRTSPWTHSWVFWLVCAASWIWGFPCLPLKHWDCQWALMCTQFLLDSGSENSGFQAYTTSNLPTLPSPQPTPTLSFYICLPCSPFMGHLKGLLYHTNLIVSQASIAWFFSLILWVWPKQPSRSTKPESFDVGLCSIWPPATSIFL